MIKVTLTRKSDLVVALTYIGDDDLFSVHDSAEKKVNKLLSLKVGDKVLVRAEDVKTGNSINTAVNFSK